MLVNYIYKKDYYRLCSDFSREDVNLKSINGSFRTSVPKVANPESVNDFGAASARTSGRSIGR